MAGTPKAQSHGGTRGAENGDRPRWQRESSLVTPLLSREAGKGWVRGGFKRGGFRWERLKGDTRSSWGRSFPEWRHVRFRHHTSFEFRVYTVLTILRAHVRFRLNQHLLASLMRIIWKRSLSWRAGSVLYVSSEPESWARSTRHRRRRGRSD